MPDTRLASSLLSTSKKLAPKNSKRASQANLRRSISTAYFAVFHCLARNAADSLVGKKKSTRPKQAWVEVYRGISHGACKTACEDAKKIAFPECITNFADNFVQLQYARCRADYDPLLRPTLKDAQFYISLAELAIEALNSASAKDKLAFSTWVLVTSPGAKSARAIAKENKTRSF